MGEITSQDASDTPSVTLASPLHIPNGLESHDKLNPTASASAGVAYPTDLSNDAAVENGRPSHTGPTAGDEEGLENGFPFHAANGTAGESPTNILGKSREEVPTTRRSVQFARSTTSPDISSASHNPELPTDGDPSNKEGAASKLLSRIRSFATPSAQPGHVRTFSGFMVGDAVASEGSRPRTPGLEGSRPRPLNFHDEGDEDADVDESGEDDHDIPTSRKIARRVRRIAMPSDSSPQTAPTTPKSDYFGRDTASSTPTANSTYRPQLPNRRATMTDIPENQRQGVSEDEGRDRLTRAATWKKKGAAWVQGNRGESYGIERRRDKNNTSDSLRPSNFRRITTLASGSRDPDASPSPWRQRTARTTTASAQKWKQVKAGLKLLGQKKQEEKRKDHLKSAELMAELLAGSPAAVIAASMFQRDEREKKKIPVLLEQLKINITDSQRREDAAGDRHLVFRIELEYGSGLTRMKWVIHRTLRDFANLHVKYKSRSIISSRYSQRRTDDPKTAKLPRFPRSAFPYLRGVRGLFDDEEDEDDAVLTDEASGPDGPSTAERPERAKRRQSSINPMINPLRRRSSVADTDAEAAGGPDAEAARKEAYIEKQRKKLENYLQDMIRFLIFRPGSNRLCRFLELSALGIRLAAEGGYHGKEGHLVIQSGKGIDFRRGWTPRLIINRHSPMWFLVRHSYIVCVDSPEEMNIYDVFLVDPQFEILPRRERLRDQKNTKDFAKTAKYSAAHPTNHLLRLYNSERKIKLLAKNERLLLQFEESIKTMKDGTEWSKQHRFDSFAPVRSGVFAQWLVDGRDYMWNVSRAINMARDVIYIHDWWLSPELYLRRPAAISQKWRLDRLLQKKAQEGVKVFVIMYRNINSAIPIDSEYSKFSLLDLHPNVFVQRSPNQVRQNVFFWAHHEKVCIIDHTVAFCGGVDLCFGRWDTPQHSVIDDKLTGFENSALPKDADHCQLWPGKDYSNPRVLDFFKLDKPYEEMYDRTKVPRMPWHDIGMQIVGQPARDLTRHFVQRWNFILRQRKPSRPTPFLLPPPDFLPADLEALGLDGTCEIQILRSAAEWSIGTPEKVECSIMNAYIKMIEASDHFVYIENQFFITSCEVEGSKIHNLIGDALVERIIRAHKNREEWLGIILIPLMPGFQSTVDTQDGTSIRLIMQCQFRSICRGSTSIFERLRAAGVTPEDYIQFYSLRSWGKIGPTKVIVTEQLYIHAKVMIVDDRVAIIGSANINERSMLGSRDSEIAAIVRDTDMLPSTMAGEPYRVGRFPHTLRMRLMREHLGVDVDHVEEEEREEQLLRQDDVYDEDYDSSRSASPTSERSSPAQLSRARSRAQENIVARTDGIHSFNHDFDLEQAHNPYLVSGKRLTSDPRVTGNADHARDVRGEGFDNMAELNRLPSVSKGRDVTMLKGNKEVLVNDVAAEGKGTLESPKKLPKDSRKERRERHDHRDPRNHRHVPPDIMPPPQLNRMHTFELGLTQLSQLPPLPNVDDTDIGGPPLQRTHSKASAESSHPVLSNMRRPIVEENCMQDPLNSMFFNDTWHAVAENNTRIFRQVFRCMPDNQVTNWKDYENYMQYAERFAQSQGLATSSAQMQQDAPGEGGGPPGHNLPPRTSVASLAASSLKNKPTPEDEKNTGISQEKAVQNSKSSVVGEGTDYGALEKSTLQADEANSHRSSDETNNEKGGTNRVDFEPSLKKEDSGKAQTPVMSEALGTDAQAGGQKRRRRGTTKSSGQLRPTDPILPKADAEELCKLIQGHLVIWPTEWLSQEERGGKWLYSVDQMAPLEIYD